MTQGISPKVKLPAGVLAALGVVVVALSFIEPINEVVGLREAGLAMIGSSGLGGFLGFKADPGEVAVDLGPASDVLLETVVGIEELDQPGPDDEPDPDARPA